MATLGAVLAAIGIGGGALFSPGGLNAENRRRVALGGVSSHIELGGNCAACHAPPWSDETMGSRCLACHTDVRKQLDARLPLHGRMPDGSDCRSCHSEHNGPHGRLTSFERFDHDFAAFPLTGRHKSVECRACHKTDLYRGTPQSCVACHAEPQAHLGRFGADCAKCHSTATWKGATFEHRFPLNHGRGKRDANACVKCHTEPADYKIYTCYGCHRHDPEKTEKKHVQKGIVEFRACAKCHPTGRKERKAKEKAETLEPGHPTEVQATVIIHPILQSLSRRCP